MTSTPPLLRRVPFVATVAVVLGLLCASAPLCAAAVAPLDSPLCPAGAAVETDGSRRLALIVGVGQYKKDAIPDLVGPPNDARRAYELLTGPNGYGFPRENVCLLLDDAATTANFKHAFASRLVDRAKAGDVAVLFYAGHGSQAPDKNGDEPDEWDETLVLQDARTGGVHDLVDDELNQMLAQLHAKTSHITVILDSCNSGSATRGDTGTFIARYVPPEEGGAQAPSARGTGGDGGAGSLPDELPGLVAFTAATDGTVALETNGHGIFTDALFEVLSRNGQAPWTYAQVARQARPLVAARSYQIPYFQGDLSSVVFGNRTRSRPLSWEVIAVGPPLQLGGPAFPGMGQGAELRIYPGSATGADTLDPAKAKATAIIDAMSGLNAAAHVSASDPGAPAIEAGDLAVLVRPGDRFLKLRVRLRPAAEPGGIASDRLQRLSEAVESDPEAALLVGLTADAGDFELSVGGDGRLVLRGPENRVRNVFDDDQLVPKSLWQHARQQALLLLRGEGGGDYVDQQTLSVQLVPAPAAKQSRCAKGGWVQAPANTEQLIPLCHAWNVKVRLSSDAPTPLLVGGIVLSSDGGLFGFPHDGRQELLHPGESVTFSMPSETFLATLPLDVQDRVIVFGTQETNPVPWHLMTSSAATRAAGPPKSALYAALDRYLTPGSRGVSVVEEQPENTTWTMSTVTLRVTANPRFAEPDQTAQGPPSTREYTIATFDIRPYLPDDRTTALYQVLAKADWLANASLTDGFGYKQHAWSKPTDEQNLKLGIDCSRAIWFAFTRAGLPYNSENRYLSTAQMVSRGTPMAEEFDSCSDDPQLRLGDILVYRDDKRGDGHVVMVIDPDKRIAWGSHGWDGNAGKLPIKPDTGVEYQRIKYKKDWERWDRPTMRRKACWRYREFAKEAQTARGQPGLAALANVCDADQRCGLVSGSEP